jgi:transcriptional regulator with XRE-family HTH domain
MVAEHTRRFRRLLRSARHALGMSQFDLGQELGVSARTIIRWERGHTVPVESQLCALADLVRDEDEDLASEVLEAGGVRVEVAAPTDASASPSAQPAVAVEHPQAPVASPAVHPVALPLSIDSVLLAAAAAADLAPRLVRPAIAAAFARALELGISVDVAAEALGAKK